MFSALSFWLKINKYYLYTAIQSSKMLIFKIFLINKNIFLFILFVSNNSHRLVVD